MSIEAQPPEAQSSPARRTRSKSSLAPKALLLLGVLLIGFSGGFFAGRQSMHTDPSMAKASNGGKTMALVKEINPTDGYEIPATFGDVGPKLLSAGGIDFDKFVQLYQQAGKPLDNQQLAILTEGSTEGIVINSENAQFLLNFFWALGLINQNPVLTEGPMMEKGINQVGNFASTGGWTIGVKPATELYASTLIVPLSPEQQARLVDVASAVFRPCCDNPTHFPDCNHGMAMLGLLELMASQNASVDEMFVAAKYVNAFWYPQQMLEIATYFQATQNVSFTKADARQVVSRQYSSGSGFQAVHQWLANNNLLEQTPGGGGSCAVQ
jgi:hypothetical protein